MALTGPQMQAPMTPVDVQNKDIQAPLHINKIPKTEPVPEIVAAQAKEVAELKDKLATQEALRSRERNLKKVEEEELKKTAESLCGDFDRS